MDALRRLGDVALVLSSLVRGCHAARGFFAKFHDGSYRADHHDKVRYLASGIEADDIYACERGIADAAAELQDMTVVTVEMPRIFEIVEYAE